MAVSGRGAGQSKLTFCLRWARPGPYVDITKNQHAEYSEGYDMDP
jgi:hypothetical protein